MICRHCNIECELMWTKYKCKKCFLLRRKKYRDNHKTERRAYHSQYQLKLTARFKRLLVNAKTRNLEVTLTFDEYVQIVENKKCYYCNDQLDTGKGKGSKIDRLDNSQGYTLENSVCCCTFCNKIKSNLLNVEETKAAILAIIAVRKAAKL